MDPLVSCICPTMESRLSFLPRAIKSFMDQDYPNLEMVVVWDGLPLLTEVGTLDRPISHFSCACSLGAKRNLACSMAHGTIICTFDDDDQSRHDRVSHQVALLLESGKSVLGYQDLLVEEDRPINIITDAGKRRASRWWRWFGWTGDDATGSSLCYLREWWVGHPFIDANRGEDSAFFSEAYRVGKALSVPGGDRIMVTNHRGNISERLIGGAGWEELGENPW